MPYNTRIVNCDKHRIKITSYNVFIKGAGRETLSAQIYLISSSDLWKEMAKLQRSGIKFCWSGDDVQQSHRSYICGPVAVH